MSLCARRKSLKNKYGYLVTLETEALEAQSITAMAKKAAMQDTKDINIGMVKAVPESVEIGLVWQMMD